MFVASFNFSQVTCHKVSRRTKVHVEHFLYAKDHNTNWTSADEPKTRERLKGSNLCAYGVLKYI